MTETFMKPEDVQFTVTDVFGMHSAAERFSKSSHSVTEVGPVVARVGMIGICAIPRYSVKRLFGRYPRRMRLKGFKLVAVFPSKSDTEAPCETWDIAEYGPSERWPLSHMANGIVNALKRRAEAKARIAQGTV